MVRMGRGAFSALRSLPTHGLVDPTTAAHVPTCPPEPPHPLASLPPRAQMRLGIALSDWKLARAMLAVAKDLNEKGGDWDRRNRLKVYEGVIAMVSRGERARGREGGEGRACTWVARA